MKLKYLQYSTVVVIASFSFVSASRPDKHGLRLSPSLTEQKEKQNTENIESNAKEMISSSSASHSIRASASLARKKIRTVPISLPHQNQGNNSNRLLKKKNIFVKSEQSATKQSKRPERTKSKAFKKVCPYQDQEVCDSNGNRLLICRHEDGCNLKTVCMKKKKIPDHMKIYPDDYCGTCKEEETTTTSSTIAVIPTPTPSKTPSHSPSTSLPREDRALYCGVPNKCRNRGGNEVISPKTTLAGVRCCTNNAVLGWPYKCRNTDGVYGESNVPSCYRESTFDEAAAICEAYDGGRLCSGAEILDGCTAGTGCGLNNELVWGCTSTTNECNDDAECCSGLCIGRVCLDDTISPSKSPSTNPTSVPTQSPSHSPSRSPSKEPSTSPTKGPSLSPSANPTLVPTRSPTKEPTTSPSKAPSKGHSRSPSLSPTREPTRSPSLSPSRIPSKGPSLSPSKHPSIAPTTAKPSVTPTQTPSKAPSSPSSNPTPSSSPSTSPSKAPSRSPTTSPTKDSDGDGLSDTREGTIGTDPENWDTDNDSLSDFDEVHNHGTNPLQADTDGDGVNDGDEVTDGSPTSSPSKAPTTHPSRSPSHSPTTNPSQSPSKSPSKGPSLMPSTNPTANPSQIPSRSPSIPPTTKPTSPINSLNWDQIGDDIDSESGEYGYPSSVSMSANGSRVAIGFSYGNADNDYSGHVRVYEYNGSTWSQLGQDIDGEGASDESGFSVSLSSNGNIVAIGAPDNDDNGSYSGHVRVYKYDETGWTQLGDDIDGESAGDQSGHSISLSSNGNRVAVGAPYNDGNESNSGHVRVFEYNGSSWTQIGNDIDGESAGDSSGYSVSLSADGSKVAIGAYRNDGNGSNSGHVRVYEFIESSWVQVGGDIDGESANDWSGWSVSLSSNGERVAIGAVEIENDGNGISSGHVRVYEFIESSWVQVGGDIDGENAYDQSGFSVSLSANGSIVAIGAPLNDGNGYYNGHVRVYEYNGSVWEQLGSDIDGENFCEESGYYVSLSSDGMRVAIGGLVRVYEWSP